MERKNTLFSDILSLLKYGISLANSISALAGYFAGGGFFSPKMLYLFAGIFF